MFQSFFTVKQRSLSNSILYTLPEKRRLLTYSLSSPKGYRKKNSNKLDNKVTFIK